MALVAGVGTVETAVMEEMARPATQERMVPTRFFMDSMEGTVARGDQVVMAGAGAMVGWGPVEGTRRRAQPVATLSSTHQIRGSSC